MSTAIIDNIFEFNNYNSSASSQDKIEVGINKQFSRKSIENERIVFNRNIRIIGNLNPASSLEEIDLLTKDSEKVEQTIINDNKNVNLDIINNKLDIIESIGDNWDNDGLTKGPNYLSIKFSRELAFQITENNFMPLMVTQSVEEGTCFAFKNSDKYLYIEIYNDLEIGLIIEDYLNKKTLRNIPLKSKQDIILEINKFYFLWKTQVYY